MYYPNVPSILETDDLDMLRSMSVQQYEDCQEITLTFTLNPRKHYRPGEIPERIFLTEGAAPRFLYPSPRLVPPPSLPIEELVRMHDEWRMEEPNPPEMYQGLMEQKTFPESESIHTFTSEEQEPRVKPRKKTS